MPAVAVCTGPELENTGEPTQSLVQLLTSLIFDPVDGAGVQMPTKPLLQTLHFGGLGIFLAVLVAVLTGLCLWKTPVLKWFTADKTSCSQLPVQGWLNFPGEICY